ncbi:MAG TPA: ABC transporter permease [Pyrinomonadaceae bacterium]|jgi:putative ABC transport system permease protein
MNLTEAVRLAFEAIWAHKLRSALTLLGMMVGVAAVVVVVSLIQGFNSYVEEKIAKIGSKSFTVHRFRKEDFKDTDTIAAAQRRNKKLTLDDLAYLRSHSVLVETLGAKSLPTFLEVKRGATALEDVAVSGTTANVAEIENTEMADGRYFSESENAAAMRVAVLGADVANKLFPQGSALNREVVIGGITYRVLGVAAAKGTIFGTPQDNFVLVPLKAFVRDLGSHITSLRGLLFVAKAKSDGLFNDAIEEVRQLLRARRQLGLTEEDNFAITTPEAIIGMRDRILGTIYLVAVAVPSIALFVGGIVIMNIMLVSVTERTKEIGIRKAMGARRRDILKQFLAEAIILSALGGACGIVMAKIAGSIVTATIFPTYLSVTAIIVALTVSGGVGVLFGILPAWKAARLDPVEALRAE